MDKEKERKDVQTDASCIEVNPMFHVARLRFIISFIGMYRGR